MKPHNDVTFSQNCSCTSCTGYSSESERSSFRKVLARGSKIDKLYLAKYIPLRERKLLGKLVRTRAVYDDIRYRLVSESSLSVTDKPVLQPKRHPRDIDNELDDAAKSSLLLELVNLVDKGAALQSRRLSECCSCCGCESIDQHNHQGRGHTHRLHRPHLGSRSSLLSTRRADERRKGRYMQPKAKQISSDPCTCTAQFKDLLKPESKTFIKKLRGKKPVPKYQPPIESKEIEETRIRTSRKFRDFKAKPAGMGEIIKKSLTKVKQSGTKITKRYRIGTKQSFETIKRTQQILKARRAEQKAKLAKEKNLTTEEIVANAIKDSVLTYHEGLSFDPDFWTCEFDCDPEECDPEICFDIKTKKILNDAGIHNLNNDTETAIETKLLTSNTNELQNSSKASLHKISSKDKATLSIPTEQKTECDCGSGIEAPATTTSEREAKSTKFISSTPSAKRKERQTGKRGSSLGVQIRFPKEKQTNQATLSEYKKKNKKLDTKSGNRKQHRSSSTTQSTKSGGLALKRCFCTLKLKPKKTITNLNKMHPSKIKHNTKNQQTNEIPQTTTLLPYECAPLACVPGECNPFECLKEIKKREMVTCLCPPQTVSTNITKPSKSVSSGESKIMKIQKISKGNNSIPSQPNTAKSYEQNKQIDRGKKKKKQAVSSSFNLNLEFYKDGGDHVQSNLATTQSSFKTENKNMNKKRNKNLTHKSSQISSSGKSKFTITKHKLRRCFCTLKLAKTGKNINNKYNSRGTLTSGEGITTVPVVDRAREKRQRKHIKKYTLLPYECEPGICIPNECDPYTCLSIIKKRKLKTHGRQTGTNQRKTKSTFSITKHKPTISVKSVSTQPLKSRPSTEKVNLRRKPLHRESTFSSEAPLKPATRIGSRVSFSIEFYKEKTPSQRAMRKRIKQLEPKYVGVQTKVNNKSSQKQTVKNRQISALVQSTQQSKEAMTQSNLKRCFCTLKLHKTAKHKTQMANTGTTVALIQEDMYPIAQTTNVINSKITPYTRQLEPNECEPNFCIPGQCDPIICLERIKNRNRVKSKEFGTVTDKLKGVSVSSASNNYKKGKDAIVQSTQNAKQIKRKKYTPSVNNSEESTEKPVGITRQATRIGSNFSFNIEFSKDIISSKTQVLNKYVPVKPKTIKHRGDNFGGKHAKQSHSQTSEIKKITNATGLRPILKRCFCTRNLQNKNKMPTVMPVFVKNSFSTFYKEELIRIRDFISKQASRSRTYASSTSSTFSSTYTESSLYTAHKDLDNNQQRRINKYDLVISSTSLITKIKKENTMIGINQYLKSSFFTMNMHVQKNQKYKHKLEPYECEPGVCVPGSCDPIECQKLIMKRLMRKASTMTSTERSTHDAYSSSNPLNSKSKKQQYDKANERKIEKEQGFKYKTLPRTHKQAVRVGSSFNFNIEFSKDRTPAKQTPEEVFRSRKANEASSTNTNIKKFESKSTSGSQVPRHHSTSQSGSKMHDKGSNISPRFKRCFCTLKIQKKGRQNKALESKVKKRVENKVKTADAGQNTKKIKPYSLSDLDPNECEPYTCIPGQCDPYECLERIKRRGRNTKDFGTDMKPRKANTSSMTFSQKQSSKGKQANIKNKKTKNPVAVKAEAPIENQHSKPSSDRQVVRIGSNFSFNIEFFKDKSFPDNEANTHMSNKGVEHKQMRSQKAGVDKNMKYISTQDYNPTINQNSQVDRPAQHEKSTKTGSVFKRCFCTLNLHRQNNMPSTRERSPSVVQKYLNSVKLSMVKRHPNLRASQVTEHNAYAQTKRMKQPMLKISNVGPNECDPGVCVPGECDPFVCLERIKKRNALNQMSSTDAFGARSISTNVGSPKISKSTDAYAQNKSKTNNPEVKRRSQSEKRAKSPKNSVVRLSSNFSLNVEFYKDKSPTNQEHHGAHKEMKRGREAATESGKLISRSETGTDNSVLLHDRESQVNHAKKANKSSNAGMLKRCFCTLAIQKHGATPKQTKVKKERNITPSVEMSTRGTETQNKRIKNFNDHTSKPYKLEPYECEPGICIPGECDPYECEKLIKKRHRDFGTKPIWVTSKSATTATQRNARKNRQNQHADRSRRPVKHETIKHEPVKRVSISPKGHARQAVKIGSNFSFNIEFSKSNTGVNDMDAVNSQPVRGKSNNDTQSQSAYYRHKKTQGKRDVHHAYSQVLAKKVRSTVTEVAPLLKRCFCTLTLRNEKMPKDKIHPVPKKKQPKPPKQPKKQKTQINKVMNTDPYEEPYQALDPNECEPGTCIPGQCNPHECLKRIQKRMLSKMSNTDAGRAKKTAGTTSKLGHTSANTSTGMYRPQPTREAGDNERRPSLSPTTVGNRQVVRIGSNFSFNVEFFKDTSGNDGATSPKNTQHTVHSTGDSPSQSHAASGNRTKLVDRQLQSLTHATESKGSGVGPLMKRCFCTLKLQKVGKMHQKPKIVKKTKDNAATAKIKVKIDDNKISRDASTRVKTKHRALEPYECEPNTCIPGLCDPYECLERIKLRNLNNFGTDPMKVSTKSAFSLTDKKGQPKTNQTQLHKSAVPKSTYEPTKRKPDVSHSHTSENPNRQSVRLSSSFNFDLEFFKDSTNKENNEDFRPLITKSQASHPNSVSSYSKRQQARVLQESVGSGITPLLKRCFCTLTLHNTETNKIPCPKSKTPFLSQNKSTSTSTSKVKKRKMKDMSTDTYEPEKPEKRKGIRRRSRIGNQKGTQVPRIVEQPRFPFMSRSNWQGVRLGSNCSFHIEFYKEHLLPERQDTDGQTDTDCACPADDNKMKKNRSKIMNFVCKCLSKSKHSSEKNEKKSKPIKKYKSLTVGRVEKIITLTPYKPAQDYVYQVEQLGHANDFVETGYEAACKNKDCLRSNQREKKKRLCKEIVTILPYQPKLFCKNGSNTLFSSNCVAKGAENYCYAYEAFQGQRCLEENKHNVRKASHIKLSSKEKRMMLPQKSPATALKKFLCTEFTKGRNDNRFIDSHYNVIDSSNTADLLKNIKSDLEKPLKSNSKTMAVIKKNDIKCSIKKSLSELEPSDDCERTVLGKGVYGNHQKYTEDKGNKKYYVVPAGKKQYEKHDTMKSKVVNTFKQQSKNNTNYSFFTRKNIALPQSRVMVECACNLSKCKVKILNYQVTTQLNYGKPSYFCKNKDPNSKDTDLLKQLNKDSEVHKDHESSYNCKNQLKKTNVSKLSPGQKESKNSIFDYDKKYIQNIKKDSHQMIEIKSSEKNKQMKRQVKKTFPIVPHRKLYKKHSAVKQAKKIRSKTMTSKTMYQTLQKSVPNAAIISTAVLDEVRTTKHKSEENSKNYLINKRNNKKLKEPTRFGTGPMPSIRKKPWLVIYYPFSWMYHKLLRLLSIWKQSTEVVLYGLAVVLWSPCNFLVKRCKAAKFCTCKS